MPQMSKALQKEEVVMFGKPECRVRRMPTSPSGPEEQDLEIEKKNRFDSI